MTSTVAPTLRVFIFDDVVHARGETFELPGLDVSVYPHADDCVALCTVEGHEPDVVFMDFEMGREHDSGDAAVLALRGAGYAGRVVGISSDPMANQKMRAAGSNDSLSKKAHLRSFLVHMASGRGEEP